MQRLVDRITRYCVNEDLIKQEEIQWFRYSLERKLSMLFVGIPFLIIAFTISNSLCAISFFSTYFFVRKYIGGYHAKTIWGCLAFSLLLELVFLGMLPHLLTIPVLLGVLGISFFAIFRLAPYNHPNMHLTTEEIRGCRQRGLLRTCLVMLVGIIACFAKIKEIANGCTIGIAMAATLLCLGYIYDWRKPHHEKQQNQGHGKSDHF